MGEWMGGNARRQQVRRMGRMGGRQGAANWRGGSVVAGRSGVALYIRRVWWAEQKRTWEKYRPCVVFLSSFFGGCAKKHTCSPGVTERSGS